MKTVGLIGLGALGIMFGWQLQQKLGNDFCVIVDEERKETYLRQGIFANGEPCQFRFVTPQQASEPLDLLIFGTKIGGLRAAIATAKPFVGPTTVVLSLLNGVSSEEIIGESYGAEKVLLAVSQEMDAVRVGTGVRYTNMGCIVYGEPNGELTARVTEVERILQKGGVVGRPSREAKRILWNKLMINVGVNQVSAAYNATYGDICKKPEVHEVFLGAMREAMMIGCKEGVDLSEDDVARWISLVEKLDPNSFPSMLQDVRAKRYTEVELFGKTIVQLGKKSEFPPRSIRCLSRK
uniref:2-dehydropantoate 2-reductase n=1 Tax=Angomonas desouzai TaxID=59800 RepID=T1YT96_9TRYP|nr:2-dehydropantoate 2-reductase [Angomonas desouzai]